MRILNYFVLLQKLCDLAFLYSSYGARAKDFDLWGDCVGSSRICMMHGCNVLLYV